MQILRLPSLLPVSLRMTVVDWGQSVVVGAAEVVAAVGADELAVVAGEAMAAGGADLAVVIDKRYGGGQNAVSGAERTTL
jgi:hypothetical protein